MCVCMRVYVCVCVCMCVYVCVCIPLFPPPSLSVSLSVSVPFDLYFCSFLSFFIVVLFIIFPFLAVSFFCSIPFFVSYFILYCYHSISNSLSFLFHLFLVRLFFHISLLRYFYTTIFFFSFFLFCALLHLPNHLLLSSFFITYSCSFPFSVFLFFFVGFSPQTDQALPNVVAKVFFLFLEIFFFCFQGISQNFSALVPFSIICRSRDIFPAN